MNKRADTAAVHPADSHDLIRVQGARVNNLKNVTIEIPKRRLTCLYRCLSGSGRVRWYSERCRRVAAPHQRDVQRIRAGLHANAGSPGG